MPLLRDWREANGYDHEQMAALLTERVGRPISAHGVKTQEGRPDHLLNEDWAKTLGLAKPDPPAAPERPLRAGDDEPPRADPKPPAEGATLLPAVILDEATVKSRIAAIYTVMGKGAAQSGGNPKYEQIFVAHADQAAEAWLKLARKDKRVAELLQAMTMGGPWGGVIWVHLSLFGALLVASGRVRLPGMVVPPPVDSDAQDARVVPHPAPDQPSDAERVAHLWPNGSAPTEAEVYPS